MSVRLDARIQPTGTRFRLFPLPRHLNLPSFAMPETVVVNVPPDKMSPGPADDRMFVVDALNKQPYSRLFRPPFQGDKNPPVQPAAGHFDTLSPDSREFLCATMYATVRRVLDIWEDYFEHIIDWHFEPDFAKLELIPLIEWDNAQSGYGFLEFGFGRRMGGGIDHRLPYCANFDVLAHELGHSIVFSEVGVPSNPADPAVDYGGLHESAGDLVAIVAVLHFDSVVKHLLDTTHGNLFTVNELARVGELDASREIRTAFNYKRMSDVGDKPHDRSLPLTGGVFDVMVEVFQKELVRLGLISEDLARRSSLGPTGIIGGGAGDDVQIQREFDAAYRGKSAEFAAALLGARDYVGRLLAKTWSTLRPPNFLTYHDVLRALLRADRDVSGGVHQQTIRECFAWREISVVPNSLLLRSHSVESCGKTLGREVEFSDVQDQAIARLLHQCQTELSRRKSVRARPPSAGRRAMKPKQRRRRK